ncbi:MULTISPECIES: hypothetical protein [unclassified Arthrobacter]|uniref:hypothetical protein n=1 Tax=unclassified Arthrobacter TaxID=235627 RepID=UPI002E06111A|nr:MULTISPECIES: hypothetical protein [unclassified Arthrobacter]MEC5193131.1 hypothetical protein [Arthrobacter sp. MP_M4]MEC5204591.1 hypothetical protein [Arthrobacter sp. MP_M7]
MTITQGQVNDYSPDAQPFWEAPFTETAIGEQQGEGPIEPRAEALGFLPWAEDFSPFSEAGASGPAGEAESLLDEAFEAVRDEAFDEAVGELLAETEDAIAQRFSDEAPTPGAQFEKERLAENYLAPVLLASEQYLDRLAESLAGQDLESLDALQLDEVLDRLDPSPEVSPAGEEFIGGIIRKAKRAVKFVVNTAKKVGQAAGGLLLSALKGLKKLISPLLKRVLSFAIGRLPAPLQAPARLLSRKLLGENEYEGLDEYEHEGDRENEDFVSSPAIATDTEALVESFDAALAEALITDEGVAAESESFDLEQQSEGAQGSLELEALAEARGKLIDALQNAHDGEDLTPAVEQFVPVLLAALRTGIHIVGRPRVVGFLAKYLAQLIGKWVGPQLARPLSNAIVDTGLRLVSLEQMEPENEDEAVPVMLASTIEDTIRGLAETEEYQLEDEDLMQFATAQAFERAVAANFPAPLVRPGLRRAPALGGRFVARRPRSPRPYRRYSRTPEVEVTGVIASRVATFGGVTLAASLKAMGLAVPFKARVHIFQATVGTSLRRIAAHERKRRGGSFSSRQLHPLTPSAAALLLREPGLGVAVSPVFLRSRQRVAAGQRFYYLEPVSAGAVVVPPGGVGRRAAASQPTQGWLVLDTIAARVTAALYFSEPDAQKIADGVRAGRGSAVVIPAVTSVIDGLAQSFATPNGRVRIVKEYEEGEEFLGPILKRLMPVLISALRRAIKAWLMRVLAEWVRSKGAEFARAAADPRSGVTITVSLINVPGMPVLRQALNGTLGRATIRSIVSGDAFRGTPNGSVLVRAGQHRP